MHKKPPKKQVTANTKETEKPLNVKEGYSCFQTSNAGIPLSYKFHISVVVFPKAVDPALVTQAPVALTTEMVAVHADAPPLNDVNRQLLNLIEVYEQNGSGWVFFKLCHYGTLIR